METCRLLKKAARVSFVDLVFSESVHEDVMKVYLTHCLLFLNLCRIFSSLARFNVKFINSSRRRWCISLSLKCITCLASSSYSTGNICSDLTIFRRTCTLLHFLQLIKPTCSLYNVHFLYQHRLHGCLHAFYTPRADTALKVSSRCLLIFWRQQWCPILADYRGNPTPYPYWFPSNKRIYW
jgi:hypothetical protein